MNKKLVMFNKTLIIGIIVFFIITSSAALPCISATNTAHKLDEIVASDQDAEYYSNTYLTLSNPPIPPVMWTEDFYTFYISTPQNPDGDHIYYLIDWGDGTSSGWIGPYEPGETISVSHVWSDEGTYQIKAKAKDQDGESKCAVYSLTLSSDLKFFGIKTGYVDIPYTFTIYWKEGCDCWIMIDWGDGETSDWLGPYEQPLLFTSHAWSLPGEYVLRIKIKDIYGNESDWIIFIITILSLENNPPAAPTINGPTSGKVGVEYKYNFSLSDPDNDSMYLRVDWGSGTPGKWDGLFSSGSVIKYNYTWRKKATYLIRAQTQDSNGLLSDWTEFEVTIPRNKATTSWWYQWFLERFPVLEVFLRAMNLLR